MPAGSQNFLVSTLIFTTSPLVDRNATAPFGHIKEFFTDRDVVSLPRQDDGATEYLVSMTTRVPEATPDKAVEDIRPGGGTR
jgi:hypothetical protein